MNISKQLEEVKEAICDEYCRFPEMYFSEHKDVDEATERLLEEKCDKCPLMKL